MLTVSGLLLRLATRVIVAVQLTTRVLCSTEYYGRVRKKYHCKETGVGVLAGTELRDRLQGYLHITLEFEVTYYTGSMKQRAPGCSFFIPNRQSSHR